MNTPEQILDFVVDHFHASWRGIPIDDICLVGSRLHGQYRDKPVETESGILYPSDYDIIVYTPVRSPLSKRKRCPVLPALTIDETVRMHIKLYNPKDVHRLWGKFLLPKMSLLDGTVFDYKKPEIEGYREHRSRNNPRWLEGRKTNLKLNTHL